MASFRVTLLLLICTVVLGVEHVQATKTIAYVTFDHLADSEEAFDIHKLDLVDGEVLNNTAILSDNLARANYAQKINETGWAFLEIQTSKNFADEKQAFAAGMVEGYLTYDLIYMHWFNTVKDFCQDRQTMCTKIQKYVDKNQRWINSMIASSSMTDPYWYQVNLFYKQLQGLAKGYTRGNSKGYYRSLTFNDLLWLNMDGDLEDLATVFDENATDSDRLTRGGRVLGAGSCSALVKVLPDGSDLYVAHDTWSGYNTMLRIQKKYVLPFRKGYKSKDTIPGKSMSFSSFPGGIQSGDDFFLISSGLVTLETTIGNSNASRWALVKPTGQVLEVVRTMIANRLGHSGRSWTTAFSRYNSGTYNNQWMVVDYKRFKPGTAQADLLPDLLWVLEQIPGFIKADDVTQTLRDQSYWPSYNVPSFKEVFQLAGQEAYVDKYGDWFTYERNPRARIFRRDHHQVTDLTSMMALMRYNDFRHDPLSRCNCTPPYSAENAIAARNDLNPANGTYPFGALGHRSHGATDAKITSSKLFMNLQMIAVCGPIHNADMPPFQWSLADFESTVPHLGHPDLWVFAPVVHSWSWN